MIAKAFRVALALWLVGGWAMMVEAQDVDQSSEDQAIVGPQQELARHLAQGAEPADQRVLQRAGSSRGLAGA